ncbi:MAG: MmgE/PrpD family protein [Rhodobacteraceae bacterium]|nr:MmgE/PrpD family protein [Paracoccaceae bacterium]
MSSGFAGFSDTFAQWACQPNLDLDDKDGTEARLACLDTVACMVIGASEHQSIAAMSAMERGEALGKVKPVGGGVGLSLFAASFVNGVRAHAIDYDDFEFSGSTHPSAALFGTLCSLAQLKSLTINQVCDAWIVGYEALIWLGQALGYSHYEKGWHSSATLGPIGVAAAVSKALDLTTLQMSYVMSLAASYSAGLKAQFGTDTKAIHLGNASEAGLRAAFLAMENVTSNREVWDVSKGYFDLFGTTHSSGFDFITQKVEFGQAVKKFPVARKIWPSCAYTHRAIFGAQNLRSKFSSTDEIVGIRVKLPKPFYDVAHFGVPTTASEARFSVQYCVAAGLISEKVTCKDFDDQIIQEEKRQQLTDLVEIEAYDLPAGDSGEFSNNTVEKITISLRTGHVHEIEVIDVPGDSNNPMTDSQIIQKAVECGICRSTSEAFLAADGNTSVLQTGLLDQNNETILDGVSANE